MIRCHDNIPVWTCGINPRVRTLHSNLHINHSRALEHLLHMVSRLWYFVENLSFRYLFYNFVSLFLFFSFLPLFFSFSDDIPCPLREYSPVSIPRFCT